MQKWFIFLFVLAVTFVLGIGWEISPEHTVRLFVSETKSPRVEGIYDLARFTHLYFNYEQIEKEICKIFMKTFKWKVEEVNVGECNEVARCIIRINKPFQNVNDERLYEFTRNLSNMLLEKKLINRPIFWWIIIDSTKTVWQNVLVNFTYPDVIRGKTPHTLLGTLKSYPTFGVYAAHSQRLGYATASDILSLIDKPIVVDYVQNNLRLYFLGNFENSFPKLEIYEYGENNLLVGYWESVCTDNAADAWSVFRYYVLKNIGLFDTPSVGFTFFFTMKLTPPKDVKTIVDLLATKQIESAVIAWILSGDIVSLVCIMSPEYKIFYKDNKRYEINWFIGKRQLVSELYDIQIVRTVKIPVTTVPPKPSPHPKIYRVSLKVDPKAEKVYITNNGEEEINLRNWVLESTVGRQRFVLPQVILAPGDTITIGSGPNASGDLIWTRRYVWNDKGDKAVLYDADGNVVAVYGY